MYVLACFTSSVALQFRIPVHCHFVQFYFMIILKVGGQLFPLLHSPVRCQLYSLWTNSSLLSMVTILCSPPCSNSMVCRAPKWAWVAVKFTDSCTRASSEVLFRISISPLCADNKLLSKRGKKKKKRTAKRSQQDSNLRGETPMDF